MTAQDMQTALEYAIISLTRRRQTEKRIRERLLKRYPNEDMEPVITRLKELQYLDDRAFTDAWIQYRTRTSPRGKFALKRELLQKGISKEDAEQALSGIDQSSSLQKLAESKWSKVREPSMMKRKQKLMRFLGQRGFPMREILDIVNSLDRNIEA